MLTKAKTTGGGTVVRFKRRQQKRNPRRPLEAVAQDFEHWDAAAAYLGLNWSEFTRRVLNEAASAIKKEALRANGFGLSEKPGSKNGAAARAKLPAKRAGRKG